MSNFESSNRKSEYHSVDPKFGDGVGLHDHSKEHSEPPSTAYASKILSESQTSWVAPEEIRAKAGSKPDGLPPVDNKNYYLEHDAKALSNLGNYALEHSTDRRALSEFQQELFEIGSHGQDYVTQVFNQIKENRNELYVSDDRLCFYGNIFSAGPGKSVCGFSDGKISGTNSTGNPFLLDSQSNFQLFEAPITKEVDII